MSNHIQNWALDKTKVLPYKYSLYRVHNCVDSITSRSSYLKQGRFTALFITWLLGNGSLFAWNSMLTIGDYYAYLFPVRRNHFLIENGFLPFDMCFNILFQRYHPTRVLTLVYQPFALGTTAILAYNEARLNTRRRNLFGYSLFFLSSLGLIVVSIRNQLFLRYPFPNYWFLYSIPLLIRRS